MVEASDEVIVEEEEVPEESLIMAIVEVFGDAVECEDETDGLENKP